jgi:hypothetical protein
MPTVEIAAGRAGPAVLVEAAGPLVLVGAELLEPPGADEIELLHRLGVLGAGEEGEAGDVSRASSGQRLACQAVIRPGPGLVRLRWAGG